jgi:hypothetical protein
VLLSLHVNKCHLNYYYYYYYYSSKCMTFTIIYLKQTMFLVYTVLQLFCIYNLLHVMLLPMLNALYFYISASRSVQCPILLFFGGGGSFLILCFPGLLLRYCLSGFEMVPIAPVITGITFVSHSICAVLLL